MCQKAIVNPVSSEPDDLGYVVQGANVVRWGNLARSEKDSHAAVWTAARKWDQ